MKIITWNCNMAFRKKTGIILTDQPDILIIPECEHPDKFTLKEDLQRPTDSKWFGYNQNKGLGIFSYSHFRFKVLEIYNEDFVMVIPLAVTGGCFDFTLFAIWANNPKDRAGQYITQVWKAIQHYDTIITNTRTVLIGDFNSNTIWDKPRREGNHSAVVQRLQEKGIYSVYHTYFDQEQGKEQHPTFYLYRHKNKPYHLDYCFVSKDMLQQLTSVEIGDYDKWGKYSDHVPVTANFDLF